MLKITKNKYEIEETIQITENKEGKEEVLLEIPMQITSDELLKLKEILFGYTNKNISKYQNSTDEEKKQLENNAEKEINNHNEEIADICFKNNKEKIKEIAGEYKYEELLGDIKGFLLDFFIKKQIQPMSTTITDLTKIMSNFRALK